MPPRLSFLRDTPSPSVRVWRRGGPEEVIQVLLEGVNLLIPLDLSLFRGSGRDGAECPAGTDLEVDSPLMAHQLPRIFFFFSVF